MRVHELGVCVCSGVCVGFEVYVYLTRHHIRFLICGEKRALSLKPGVDVGHENALKGSLFKSAGVCQYVKRFRYSCM